MIKKGKYIAVRPNTLIEARYDLTSSQNDVLDMVLSKINNDNNYLYELNINEYKSLYSTDTSNIYRDLKKAVKEFEGKGFYLIDNQNKKEIFFSWFASISYSDAEGKIVVELGQRLKNLLVEMKKRIYYKIEYPLNFNSIYSKRIYYYLKSFQDTGWRIDNLDALRKKLQCPDSYKKYSFFKIKVLDMAQKEINNNSDISFEFEEIKTGRKVTGIKFIIITVKSCPEIAATVPGEEDSAIPTKIKTIKSIIQEEITEQEANTILKAAQGSIDRIKEKYFIVSQFSHIKNIVGAMIRALEQNWTLKGKTKINTFNNYSQRTYNFKELEEQLTAWENNY